MRAQNAQKNEPKPADRTPVVTDLPSEFSKDQLSGITNFDDALRLARDTHGGILAAHEAEGLGDGFRVADKEDKKRLIGVPLLLLEWTFRDGDYSSEYVSVRVIAQHENGTVGKWIINDGGTGISTDLHDFQVKTGRTGGLLVRRGLRISEYKTDGEEGPNKGKPLTRQQVREYLATGKKIGEGYTFYLDTSA